MLPTGPIRAPAHYRTGIVQALWQISKWQAHRLLYTTRRHARRTTKDNNLNLEDKIAVITGGASGLGRATSEMVIQHGGRVAIFDLNEELGRQTATELGDAARAYVVNVADEDSVTNAVQAVMSDFGAIHINVNCAGIGAAARTLGREEPMPLKYFNGIIQVNLIGTFNCLRLCAWEMQKNEPDDEDAERGVVVNTASVAAFDGQIGQAGYAASKAGVAGMTLPIARDLSRSGIRVCTIAPGIFETPMMAGASDRVRDPLIDMVQFPKRLGNAPEYALLAQQIIENRYLNGETIRLDAGIRMAPR